MNTIVQSFESIVQVMQTCIDQEMVENRILSDVNTFIPSYYNEAVVDEPVVWMTQHPSIAEKQTDISQKMELITPFEFDCAVYDSDLGIAEQKSQNLATRVVLAVVKNYLQVQRELLGGRIIKRIGLETYYPVGQVQIQGKSERITATGVVLNVVHVIDWVTCCKKLEGDD